MSALSRRNLLAGLAAATSAATAVGVEAATARECPKLVALADALPAIAEKHFAARKSYREALKGAGKEWPRPHEAMSGCGGDYEKLPHGGGHPDRKLVPSIEHIEFQLAQYIYGCLSRCKVSSVLI